MSPPHFIKTIRSTLSGLPDDGKVIIGVLESAATAKTDSLLRDLQIEWEKAKSPSQAIRKYP